MSTKNILPIALLFSGAVCTFYGATEGQSDIYTLGIAHLGISFLLFFFFQVDRIFFRDIKSEFDCHWDPYDLPPKHKETSTEPAE